VVATAKIPKSKEKLQRPVDRHHALARIEEKSFWVTSRNRELAELLAALISRDEPVTVQKHGGVVVWGSYAGALEKDGTIVLDRKPDGRFKLVPIDTTPHSLLEEVAHIVGRDDTVVSEEGRHGLIFRGVMRSADERATAEPATPSGGDELGGGPAGTEQASEGSFELVTAADAIAAIKQKVSLEFIEMGVKVRVRGKQRDCEAVAKQIIKARPTVASQQGAKYMIEGNLNKPFVTKGANQQGPDANGVTTREDASERAFTAFGENLTAVQAAANDGCKEGTIYTIVVNDRSKGYVVICSGKRRAV